MFQHTPLVRKWRKLSRPLAAARCAVARAYEWRRGLRTGRHDTCQHQLCQGRGRRSCRDAGRDAAGHDLRIPEGSDLEAVFQDMTLEEEGSVNYDEFQIGSFKASLENYGEDL